MHRIFFKTYGCSMNFSDSEVMMGLLEQEDFALTDKEEDADVLVVNTCTVKNPSESKAIDYIRKWHELGKKIVVAGCIPQADAEHPDLQGFTLVGTTQVQRIVDAVEETLQGSVVHWLERSQNPRLNLPKIRRNSLIEIIPINEGCLGKCNYCKTKLARGNLMSYSPDAIVRQFKSALGEGIREFWLTSQDTGAYGLDLKTNIVGLLEKLLGLEGDFRIRLGMGNPNMFKLCYGELIELMKDPRMFKFLHMPVQSGSNKILKAMNRFYKIEDAARIIEGFRKKIQGMTIATDIICGYPGETEDDFLQTMRFCESLEIDVINISKFYPRKGTKAAGLKKIPTRVVKERTARLAALHHKLSKELDKRLIGREFSVYFDEEDSRNGSFVGRNDYYRPVVVKHADLLGKRHIVRIDDTKNHSLYGSVV